jgi:hypothetical protein
VAAFLPEEEAAEGDARLVSDVCDLLQVRAWLLYLFVSVGLGVFL